MSLYYKDHFTEVWFLSHSPLYPDCPSATWPLWSESSFLTSLPGIHNLENGAGARAFRRLLGHRNRVRVSGISPFIKRPKRDPSLLPCEGTVPNQEVGPQEMQAADLTQVSLWTCEKWTAAMYKLCSVWHFVVIVLTRIEVVALQWFIFLK